MKKSEITFIRLMSLALIMVINAAVLLFFVRGAYISEYT